MSYLKNVQWLKNKCIFYWRDIDERGFQILHQMRGYFPQTKSVLMDIATYEKFEDLAGAGEKNSAAMLQNLTDEEAFLFKLLKVLVGKNRLEQEKIPQ